MSNVFGWMAQQPTLSPLTVPVEPPEHRNQIRRRSVLVERMDGTVVPIQVARGDLREAIVDALKHHGANKLTDIRRLIEPGLFVAYSTAGQVGEMAAAIKALHAADLVHRAGPMPYIWSAR